MSIHRDCTTNMKTYRGDRSWPHLWAAEPLDFVSITLVLKASFPGTVRVAESLPKVTWVIAGVWGEKRFLFQTSMTLCSLMPCQGPLGPG